MPKKEKRGAEDCHTFAGLAAIGLWSLTVALARAAAESLGPLTAGAVAYLAGGLPCLALALRRRRDLRGDFFAGNARYYVGCGILFVSYAALLYLAIGLAETRDEVLEIGLINYLWPVLTVVFSLPILGYRAGWGLFPGALLALAGIFLVVSQGRPVAWGAFWGRILLNPWPYGLAFLATVAWGLYSNLTRRWSPRNDASGAPWFVPATGLVLFAFRVLFPEPSVWDLRALAEAALLGAATTLAYVFWETAMQRGDMIAVAAASYLTPLLSTFASCLYLGAAPGGGPGARPLDRLPVPSRRRWPQPGVRSGAGGRADRLPVRAATSIRMMATRAKASSG